MRAPSAAALAESAVAQAHSSSGDAALGLEPVVVSIRQ